MKRKQQLERQLETVIGKLKNLTYQIEGDPLNLAIKEVEYVLKMLMDHELKPRKTAS